MELRAVFAILGRWLWLIGLCVAAGLGGAAYANRAIEPLYEAVTLVAVNQLSPEGALTNYDNLLANELLAKSYAETMNSRPILADVISLLELDTSPEQLNDHVSTVLLPSTQLMRIVVVDTNPQRAADIANSVVAVFREHNLERMSARYSVARDALEIELAAAQKEVDTLTAELARVRDPKSGTLPERIRDTENAANRSRARHTALAEAFARVTIAETQAADSIDVLEPAYPIYDPIWPDPTLNLIVAAVAGALVGCGIALFLGKPLPATHP